jgi:hypothetical protein
VDGAGRAWAAGNPSGGVTPAPVVITTRSGPDPSCPGPAVDRFPGSGAGTVHRWGSIATVPGTDTALVGGSWVPDGIAERPLLAQIACSGASTTTGFILDGEPRRSRAIVALGASAPNDAWVALPGVPLSGTALAATAPALLRLQNGLLPQAPAGDDVEDRSIAFTDDSPVPAGTPSPDVVKPPKLAKFFRFTSRFKGRTLTMNFRVRRPGLIGLQALKKGRVVATTGLKRVRPPRGVLTLTFDPKAWPTKIELITDTPTGVIQPPPRVLRGSARLTARATVLKGRKVDNVRWEYSPAGRGEWREISTSIGRSPYRLAFYTPDLIDGRYDFRVVVTDSKGEEGISPVVRRQVTNGRTE